MRLLIPMLAVLLFFIVPLLVSAYYSKPEHQRPDFNSGIWKILKYAFYVLLAAAAVFGMSILALAIIQLF